MLKYGAVTCLIASTLCVAFVGRVIMRFSIGLSVVLLVFLEGCRSSAFLFDECTALLDNRWARFGVFLFSSTY